LYLQSRGISQTKAYEMLLEAFEKTIIENIDNELIKEFVINYKGKKDV
jgi:Fe-S cluster assembly protein SufD